MFPPQYDPASNPQFNTESAQSTDPTPTAQNV
jgi:hypothetical protein